jgi:(S)-ureidoglycine-glyoxylate aminotransferase
MCAGVVDARAPERGQHNTTSQSAPAFEEAMNNVIKDLNPPPRRLMGPGPVDVDPRVLQAMAMPMLGQFDPCFTAYMNEVMALYRQVFRTTNHWTLLVDGTARAGIEAVLTSVLCPGDRVLVPIFGRFGHLLCEIATRCRAQVLSIETEWGSVFDPQQIEDAVKVHRPRLVAIVQGDTSTTMAQPLAEVGEICRRHGALLYVDATASITGMPLETDAWKLDAVSVGLQKCLSGPPGVAPLTFNERVEAVVRARRHVEQGIRPAGYEEADGEIIQSNYFDLAMIMDYWSEARLNHHTEATSMLYAARESARIVLQEGLEERFARHALVSRALTAGLTAMDLELFGDQAHKMPNVTGVYIPGGVDGEAVRRALLQDFALEIGTSFGPLHGRIWRIGTMGYGCRRDNVLTCLAALEVTLRRFGHAARPGAGVDAALAVFDPGQGGAHVGG